MLQDDQLDKDVKKALLVIFYAANANEGPNANKNIININNNLDKENLVQNKNPTDQKNSNVEPENPDTRESLKNQFAEAYKKDKLVQVIIDIKVKGLQ